MTDADPSNATPAFSGEFMILGDTPARIEADHLERYEWARRRVAGLTVADIACGSGYGSALLAQSGASSVTGVDISEEALGFARARYGESGANYESGDITSWGETDRYDLITSFETIEHLAPTEAALSNLYRILKPKGTLLISSPNRPLTSPGAASLASAPANPFHVKEFTPPELRAALEAAGFVVSGSVLGQRLQPPLPRRGRGFFTRHFKPEERLSPKLRPFRFRIPRYFVLVATKP